MTIINQDLQAFDLMVSLCTYILPPKGEAHAVMHHDLTRGRESVSDLDAGGKGRIDGGKRW